MSVTASVEDDSEGASVGTWWVQIVEPHKLVKHRTARRVNARKPPSPNHLPRHGVAMGSAVCAQ